MTVTNARRPIAGNPVGPLQGDPPPDIPRDQWGRPLIAPSHLAGQWCTPVGMTRASTLGGVSEDQWNLNRWRVRQIILGLSLRPDLVLAAKTCTAAPGDKSRLEEIADEAFRAAEGQAAATIGTSIHHLADRVDRRESVPDVGEYNITVQGYREIIGRFTVHAIEPFTVNEELSAAGTPDRIVSPNGWLVAPDGTVFGPSDRLIWDLKTSQSADYFGIKFCVQIEVYSGGRPYRHLKSRSVGRGKRIEVRGEYLDWPDGIAPSREWGLICHVPSGGGLPDHPLHWVPLEEGNRLARQANRTREDRKATLVVSAALPTMEHPGIVDPTLSRPAGDEPIGVRLTRLMGAIKDVGTEDGLTSLWTAHQDIWDETCTRIARAVSRNVS